jgi:hypothetical protein
MAKKNQEIVAECDKLIDPRLNELRRKNFDELSALSDSEMEDVEVAGKKAGFMIFQEMIENDEIKIIVAVGWSSFLIDNDVRAKGFAICRNGKIRELTEEEYYW